MLFVFAAKRTKRLAFTLMFLLQKEAVKGASPLTGFALKLAGHRLGCG